VRPDEEAFAVCTCGMVDGEWRANPACLLHFPPSEFPANDIPDEVTDAVTADAGAPALWTVTTPPAQRPGDQWLVAIDTALGTVAFTRQPRDHGGDG
jgi:hypothetical protein